jgi:multicomponent Na+:H+ antiporter subunit D
MLSLAPETLVVAALTIPLIGAFVIPLFHTAPNGRESVTLITAAALALTVWSLVPHVLAGGRPEAVNLEVVPGLRVAFAVEPLGMLFAVVASTLWIVNSVYSIGYMRGGNEPRQTSFYVCFAVALWATMGIAFAKNLFTLFIFYEILTLSTYPLVTHKAGAEAIRGGRIYLLMLIGTSMVFLLPAIAWTWLLAGTLDFTPGGILGGKAAPAMLAVLLALFAFGIGKAALMPFHFWLPAAMVAPTPVSALLHAVAVVKAGVFTILKVVVYIFGIKTLNSTGASEWLVYAACITLLLASMIALTRGNLKARLAYSTVSQLAYIVLGAALATSSSVIGAGMHIAMHAAGKITLFFCAGAIYVAAHKTEISQLDGIGRKMPITMVAFMIGSLSIIGLPPFGGTWSKWYLAVGALEAGYQFVVAVLMISSLLNVAYLMPIVARAFFMAPDGEDGSAKAGIEEAPLPCVLALSFTALLCLLLFIFPDRIESLLRALVAVG